jgi:hypothetical protein
MIADRRMMPAASARLRTMRHASTWVEALPYRRKGKIAD